MKDLSNIEKINGRYVGYCNGAWRISKSGKRWQASKQNGPDYTFADTLGELNDYFVANNGKAN